MTPPQRDAVRLLLACDPPDDFRHGDCVGSDDQAAALASGLGCWVIAHPPDRRGRYRAFSKHNDVVLAEKNYLVRNRDIVDAVKRTGGDLIAAPACLKSDPEPERHSGTWYTVRYARTVGVPIYIAYADGAVWEEIPGAAPQQVSPAGD